MAIELQTQAFSVGPASGALYPVSEFISKFSEGYTDISQKRMCAFFTRSPMAAHLFVAFMSFSSNTLERSVVAESQLEEQLSAVTLHQCRHVSAKGSLRGFNEARIIRELFSSVFSVAVPEKLYAQYANFNESALRRSSENQEDVLEEGIVNAATLKAAPLASIEISCPALPASRFDKKKAAGLLMPAVVCVGFQFLVKLYNATDMPGEKKIIIQ